MYLVNMFLNLCRRITGMAGLKRKADNINPIHQTPFQNLQFQDRVLFNGSVIYTVPGVRYAGNVLGKKALLCIANSECHL
jgi:hypothetical protein